MTTLRTAAQQALEAWQGHQHGKCSLEKAVERFDALRAAMAQQVEPDHETRAELAEQQVVQLAEERDHYRNLWQKAQEQAEPLNLRDFAVQKRLATQWGYVSAAQAEAVEPVAWSGYDLDGMVEAFSRVIEAHYQRANPFQNPIDMDAQMALRVLRGFIPAMKAYAVPPQRKPLPKHDQHCVDVPGYGLTAVRLVRAVELAHGIKEN